MTHGHFRGCLRFSFVELKKPAIYTFCQNLHLFKSFPTIYSLPCFPLKWHAYEFIPRGHPRRSRVTLKQLKTSFESLFMTQTILPFQQKEIFLFSAQLKSCFDSSRILIDKLLRSSIYHSAEQMKTYFGLQ